MQTETRVFVPDFTESKEVGPGVYKARVADFKWGEWEANEKRKAITYINWTCEQFGSDVQAENGRKIWHKTSMNGPMAKQFAQFFKACTGKEYPEGQSFNPEMLLSSEIELTIVDGKKDGQLTGFTEVKAVKAITRSH